MYRMLIVDDEPIVVDGLAYDIEWQDLGIEEVFKAYSGREAIEILNQRRIDLVIMDIHMPEIDGMYLAKLIRQKWSYSKMIIYSGYDDFDNAKKALDYKVFAYLTKPASYELIKNTICAAIKEIQNEWINKNSTEKIRKQLIESKPVILQRLLYSFVGQGRINCEEFNKWKHFDISLNQDKKYFLTIIRVDEYIEGESIKNREINNLAIYNLAIEILFDSIDKLYFIDHNDYLILIIDFEDGYKMTYLEYVAEALQESAVKTLGCIISLAWSIPVCVDELHNSYLRLTEKLKKYMVIDKGSVISPQEAIEDVKLLELDLLHTFPSISSLLEQYNGELLVKRLNQIFDIVENSTHVPVERLLEIYYVLSGALIQGSIRNSVSLDKWAGDQQQLFYDFSKMKNIESFRTWSLNMSIRYIDYMKSHSTENQNELVEKVKEIIKSRISEQLSITNIAAELFVHPNYLSRIFKHETNKTIIEYIVELRMKQAKKMLLNPNTKVYEVAEAVGYFSLAHFNRIFKREVGVTPKKYQISESNPNNGI